MVARKGTKGPDVFAGRSASEAFDGVSHYDIVTYEASTAGVVVDRTNAKKSTGDAKGDTFKNIDAFKLTLFDDGFVGSTAKDVVNGGAGNDSLSGRNGNDALTGDAGADTLSGGNGIDSLWGGGDADLLQGGADNDKLWGDGGNDVLMGGTDRGALKVNTANAISTFRIGDSLTGGLNIDTFVFNNGDGVDQILDFQVGTDLLDVNGLWFDGNLTNGEFAARDYAGGTLILFTDRSADGFVDNMAIHLSNVQASSVNVSWFI